MDFMTVLPMSPKGNIAIWVTINSLTKVTHFIPFHVEQAMKTLAEKCMHDVVTLHVRPSQHCVQPIDSLYVSFVEEAP